MTSLRGVGSPSQRERSSASTPGRESPRSPRRRASARCRLITLSSRWGPNPALAASPAQTHSRCPSTRSTTRSRCASGCCRTLAARPVEHGLPSWAARTWASSSPPTSPTGWETRWTSRSSTVPRRSSPPRLSSRGWSPMRVSKSAACVCYLKRVSKQSSATGSCWRARRPPLTTAGSTLISSFGAPAHSRRALRASWGCRSTREGASSSMSTSPFRARPTCTHWATWRSPPTLVAWLRPPPRRRRCSRPITPRGTLGPR
mmetsp:Transcript_25144/g.76303  ORF Transcript_25144/g.76303 Transcript_25144/m.76303 type:complete len:260 (-) Transcript_25144:321-1100(-)